MRYKIMAATFGLLIGMPGLASATVDLAGEKLQAYGKFRISVSQSDPDDPASSSNLTISSDSSRFGIKGKQAFADNLDGVWQVETEMRLDEGGGKDWAGRDSFAGLSGSFGTVVIGHHDTPFKILLAKYEAFRDTNGDARTILGAGADTGNEMDNRAKNMILYKNKVGAVDLMLMYSTDGENSSTGSTDNNDNDMTSISVSYHEGPLWVAGAFEDWSNLNTDGNTATIEDVTGTRLAGSYQFGQAKVGVLYESISSDATAAMERDAYSINASYTAGDLTYKAQVAMADDYKGVADSGATATSIGIFKTYDSGAQIYVIYNQVSNDNNAMFNGIDGGYGDKLSTVNGGSPSAISLGTVFGF